MRAAALLSTLVFLFTLPVAHAASTNWMTYSQAKKYKPFVEKKQYGSSISCRAGKPERTHSLRFGIRSVDMKRKPFHKWSFVLAETKKLERAIGKIRLRDHPELKWRIVDSDKFKTGDGREYTCALLYRGTGPV